MTERTNHRGHNTDPSNNKLHRHIAAVSQKLDNHLYGLDNFIIDRFDDMQAQFCWLASHQERNMQQLDELKAELGKNDRHQKDGDQGSVSRYGVADTLPRGETVYFGSETPSSYPPDIPHGDRVANPQVVLEKRVDALSGRLERIEECLATLAQVMDRRL